MSPELLEEKVERFQDVVTSTERVGVSEFARSKEWRDRLPQAGCFEVVDRNGVVGYMLDSQYAKALSAHIIDLETALERAQIAAMLQARKGRTDLKSGEELTSAALACFDERADELAGIIDGD